MTKQEIKIQTDQLIEALPEDTSWEDLIYSIYVRKKIDKGLEDVREESTYSSDEIRKKLGIE